MTESKYWFCVTLRGGYNVTFSFLSQSAAVDWMNSNLIGGKFNGFDVVVDGPKQVRRFDLGDEVLLPNGVRRKIVGLKYKDNKIKYSFERSGSSSIDPAPQMFDVCVSNVVGAADAKSPKGTKERRPWRKKVKTENK